MTSRLLVIVILELSATMFSISPTMHGQSPEPSAPHCQHSTGRDASHDHEAMMGRGEKGMGFSQIKTTHHFLLTRDGGVIAVSANDAKDAATRDQIRMHLTHVAHSFCRR